MADGREHYVRPEGAITPLPAVAEPHRDGRLRRFGAWLTHLLDDREPEDYSSISPRRPDGTRTKIFWFNGNGRGR